MNLTDIDIGWVLINVVVLLFSLSIHECAHAWTAWRLGDPTAKSLGRVTLNPVAHIDPIGTILFPLLGVLSGFVLFGWARPVPVNTARLKDPKKDHVLIAGAGPA
ncbi:MAG TPA: site-2 protease family protein, partial [Acidobacteriota bacterium]|nr:site-2 protease family protein [Acidobacteriota bacterium]